MANVTVDEDQQWLLNCLSATLDPNQEVRSFAEASLNQASLQPGFGRGLSKVAANRDLPFGLRQLAAVLLKHFIKKHWHEGDESFEHPAVSSDEKAVIRGLLLSTLDDSNRKLCTAISMAIASIAVYDWPESWPDLLPFLLKLIGDQSDMNGVHGALRCLALLAGDLDDTMIPTLIPFLFPCLYTIVSSSQIYNKYLRSKALSIVYACISMLGDMRGVYQAETSALMEPMLKPWIDQFSFILEHPVQPEDPDDWGIRMEVFKCLNQFVQNFHSFTESEFMVIVGPLWQTFISSLRVYTRSAIEGTEDPYEGRYDSDGAEKSLDSFVIQITIFKYIGVLREGKLEEAGSVKQLFEFLLTIVGSKKLVKVVETNIADLVYYTIGFLQVTEQQHFGHDVSSAVLVVSIFSHDHVYSVSFLLSFKKSLTEGQNQVFCVMLAHNVLGFVLLQMMMVHTWSMDANQFVADEDDATYSCRVSGSLLLEEVATCFGREGIDAILKAVRKQFSESQQEKAGGSVVWWRIREATLFALSSLSEQLLEAEVPGLGNLLEQMITEDMGIGVHEYPFLYARMFVSVARFSSMISCGILEHFLHAAIRTIGINVPPAVKVGACRALSQLLNEANKSVIQPQIMGLLSSLTDLLHQASDETLHLVLETLQAAIRAGHESSASAEPIISPIILNMWALHVSDPFVSIDAIEVLEAIKDAPGCIRPLASRILPYLGPILNKNAPTDVVKAAYDVCFDAIIRIVLQSDDHSEMQNATECLASFVSGGRQEVLAWGSDSGFTMRNLLDAASRLLDPDLESSGSLFVGSYILQLILHLPSQMAQHIRDLIVALVRREIQGAYQIKVTASALALLLSTRHDELTNINVQGHLIKSVAGITTRSKAKSAPDQWTMVPLPAKILAVLADALIEIQEQVWDAKDEDSDWEEIHEGDMEADKDLLYSAAATPFGRSANEHLEAMAKAYNEDQEDDYEDDMLSVSDPLNEINLANYLMDFILKFSQSDRQLFDYLCQSLTRAQQNAIKIVLNR
ncbi:hypothetical protein QUC31_013766 [Theobroma cacao]